jgi:hypothetical protein
MPLTPAWAAGYLLIAAERMTQMFNSKPVEAPAAATATDRKRSVIAEDILI